eukprot:gene606-754_t
MPTILLFDVSMSMARSICCGSQQQQQSLGSEDQQQKSNELITFKELMQSSVLYLIQSIEQKSSHFMADPISLFTYSSNAECIVPFTKNLASIKSAILNDIHLSDITDLPNALKTAIKYVQTTFGDTNGLSVQIFIFTDSCTSFDQPTFINNNENNIYTTNNSNSNCNNNNNVYSELLSINIPFIHQIHFLSICLSHESSDSSDSIQNNQLQHHHKQKNISKVFPNLKGTIDIIKYSKSSNIRHDLTTTINNIILQDFSLYRCILAFGHLNSPITLFPNPITLFKYLNDGTDSSTSSSFSSISKSTSCILSIIGFIPNKQIFNAPSLSRHVIIPLVSDSQPGTLPPLCPILNDCLKSEKKTAFVLIQDNWYGMINSIYENDVPVLVLSVFEPNTHLPYIGQISKLDVGSFPDHNGNQQQQQQPPQQTSLFYPTQAPHIMSYNSVRDPNNLPFIKLESFQTDLTKISRLLKNLPQKLEPLLLECEKIKQVALLYQPNLLLILSNFIREELNNNKIVADEKTGYIIKDLLIKMESYSQMENPIRSNSPRFDENVSSSSSSTSIKNLLC